MIFNDICGCSFCDDKTHVFLGILYGLTLICNFIAVVVWMSAGVCDHADPNLEVAFREDTINYPGYSLCGMMICVVANMIGCGCACCAKDANQKYEDESDQQENHQLKEKDDEMKPGLAKDSEKEPLSMELAQKQYEELELQRDVLKDREPGMPVQAQLEIQEQPAEPQRHDDFTYR